MTHGRTPALTFATDRRGGFTDADIAKFRRLLDYLAPVTESHISHLVTTTLMNTYLGRIVGEQILSGRSSAATVNRSTPCCGSPTCATSPA